MQSLCKMSVKPNLDAGLPLEWTCLERTDSFFTSCSNWPSLYTSCPYTSLGKAPYATVRRVPGRGAPRRTGSLSDKQPINSENTGNEVLQTPTAAQISVTSETRLPHPHTSDCHLLVKGYGLLHFFIISKFSKAISLNEEKVLFVFKSHLSKVMLTPMLCCFLPVSG